ncbi:glycoside hydrolase family 2 TIM barrel-domain containing protein [Microbulbifer magnicolonia]|uniref:glycoside hydrolase family 2 TIM barrel-domain containing protein n=1 Tax=Microbulbifer magnicolonia TaxID=3109744 RepID=UPI002B40660B|nr:glycoside hydrolase family 2 TIM barrel-domain containing protein [Microbulbifer sp. GG15]
MKSPLRILFGLFLCLVGGFSQANTFGAESLNDGWLFALSDEPYQKLIDQPPQWRHVSIPHTWNAEDTVDEEPGYHRGSGWYRRQLNLEMRAGEKFFLKFEAVNQRADVFVNGQHVGSHSGGYTAFVIDITDALRRDGRNLLWVKADNRHNPAIAPLKGDFNFYGGIYRDVWLLRKQNSHFDFGDYATTGVYLHYPEVSAKRARLKVSSHLKVAEPGLVIRQRLYAPDGELVSEQNDSVGQRAAIDQLLPSVKSPRLWSPSSPDLYRLQSDLLNSAGDLVDSVTTAVGFRFFEFDAKAGFSINGKPLKLMGVNRHQDYAGVGNGLSNERHRADMALVKRSGSNFFRTAHYPQDQAVLNAADQLGLLVTMEIPLDHEITDSDDFYSNTIHMHKEMLYQYFNHPSIIIWAYMNEMLLGRNFEREKEHIEKITAFARVLEEITREIDPIRYTMIPNHGSLELYKKAGLIDIPMLVGWNLYYGWYENDIDGLGQFMDRFHQEYPDKPTLITEYGAGSDPRIRSVEPRRFDFSLEWQNAFMQHNLSQIMAREFIAGAAVWNLFDFGSAGRRDAVPMINSKGLMTFDRKPKDAFYLLQSWLSEEAVLRLAPLEHLAGRVNNQGRALVPISVYGNLETATLYVNGEAKEPKELSGNVATWEVDLQDGENLLAVKGWHHEQLLEDTSVVEYRRYESVDGYSRFRDVFINAGANFQFYDAGTDTVWLPDSEYQPGTFGYQDGEMYFSRSHGVGTDEDIVGTDLDPLLQTQRQGNSRYVFDVLPGTYELVLMFADLAKNQQEPRVLSIQVNGEPVWQLDTAVDDVTRLMMLEKRFTVNASGSQVEVKVTASENTGVNGIGLSRVAP